MKIFITRPIQIQEKNGQPPTNASIGDVPSVPELIGKKLIESGHAIDASDKEKIAAFKAELASVYQRPANLKQAKDQFKKAVAGYRSANSSMAEAQAHVDETIHQIADNKIKQSEVLKKIENSDGADLDSLCTQDSGLRQAGLKLLEILQSREEKMREVFKSGDEQIRQYNLAKGEFFHYEADRLIDQLKPDLMAAYAVFSQFTALKSGSSSASFLSMLHYVHDRLNVTQQDPAVVEKVTNDLLRGLE